jgi:hypothetical protein
MPLANDWEIAMNTRSTALFAMISILIFLPLLCLASDDIQDTATEDPAKTTARKDGQNRYADAPACLRYYGALSPQGETDLIIDQVQNLIDFGNLSQETGLYLQVMLRAAIEKFDQGNGNKAVNQLQVFIHLVNKFVCDGQLSKEDGQELIENTRFLIEALQV